MVYISEVRNTAPEELDNPTAKKFMLLWISLKFLTSV